MRKSQLFELIKAVKFVAPEEIPIIVGSQAVHAAGRMIPEIVQQSIECDFLLTGGKSETRIAINKKLGVFSQYQIENGFYADALGLATVILPTGWRERLQSFEDESGNVIAKVAEIYDIAVSKLIAGREKDFVFLKELLIREVISLDVFLERAKFVAAMPQSEVLISRLETLAENLSKQESAAIKKAITKLKSN